MYNYITASIIVMAISSFGQRCFQSPRTGFAAALLRINRCDLIFEQMISASQSDSERIKLFSCSLNMASGRRSAAAPVVAGDQPLFG